jgi:hypothetical protein
MSVLKGGQGMPIKTNCQIHNEDPCSKVALFAAVAPLPPPPPPPPTSKSLRRPSAPIPTPEVGDEICAQHPSFTAASDAFNAYERWVSRVVLPIAFQWIEEHKREVYRGIPKRMRDDIGVVIAAAFEKLQKRPYYRKGLTACANFKSGKLKHAGPINPVWGRISQKVMNDTHSVFRAETKLLKNTICM